MKTQSVKLSLIHCDSGTQSRVYINEEAVAEYTERMKEGDKFPAVDLFFDGTDYHLADGFHRVMSSLRCGFKDILANIHTGTATDALWFSIGSNRTNGVKRSPGDVRKSIEIALAKFKDKTQEEISKQVGCDRSYVAKIKSELVTSHKLSTSKTVKGKDGKTYPTKYSKSDKPPESNAVEGYAEKEWDGRVTAEETPRITMDDQWKTALGKKEITAPEPDQPKLTPLQNMMVDLDYVLAQAAETLTAPDLAKFKLHVEVSLRKLRS